MTESSLETQNNGIYKQKYLIFAEIVPICCNRPDVLSDMSASYLVDLPMEKTEKLYLKKS